ncbi:MAG: hypothetical protein WBG90_11945 [Saonia sp.]
MKITLLLIALSIGLLGYGQEDARISTVDFVQILNDNEKEAIFYYKHNWKILREMALKKEYIHSFQLLETPTSNKEPFDLMLITTYPNQEQYDLREAHFSELIKEKGKLELLNNKEPNAFRKALFRKEMVRHLN